MRRRTLRWTGILGPGLIAGLFETVRHDYLDRWMPSAYGNMATSLLVIVASALLLGQVFRLMERAEDALRVSEARNSVLHERERIARDLHDGISQSIFYLNVKVQEIDREVPADHPATVKRGLAEVQNILAGLYERVRQTIFELNATEGLGMERFEDAVRQYVSDFEDRFGIDVRIKALRHECGPECPGAEVELLRILQEALLNVRRHAGVDYVEVALDTSDPAEVLVVRDKGKGFDRRNIPGPKQGHFGFASMRERAEQLGLVLDVHSHIGQGTTLRLVRNEREARVS